MIDITLTTSTSTTILLIILIIHRNCRTIRNVIIYSDAFLSEAALTSSAIWSAASHQLVGTGSRSPCASVSLGCPVPCHRFTAVFFFLLLTPTLRIKYIYKKCTHKRRIYSALSQYIHFETTLLNTHTKGQQCAHMVDAVGSPSHIAQGAVNGVRYLDQGQ